MIVRGQPGRAYDVDKIRAEPFLLGYISRQWVRLIWHPDGRIKGQPWRWEA